MRGGGTRRRLAAVACGAALAGFAGCAAPSAPAAPPDPPPARTATLHQTHVVDVPTGWRVTGRNAGPGGESTSLSGPGRTGCLVSTWSTRPAALWWPVAGRPATVQGFDATYGAVDPDYGPFPRAVLWADAAGRWFRVGCDGDRSEVLGLAGRVRAGVHPMHVPFTLGALPQGVSLVGLIETTDGTAPTVTAQFALSGPGRGQVMDVANATSRWYDQGPVERRTFAGREAELRTASQTICFPTRSDPVCIAGPGDEPATDWSPAARAAAVATAEQLRPVTDPADRSSWVDADLALPG